MAMQKGNLMAWVIMPRYGTNLETYFENMSHLMSKASIYDIGRAILFNLESVHRAGYVCNDLKLDNLMVGHGQNIKKEVFGSTMFENCSIHLVDFGYATKYLDN